MAAAQTPLHVEQESDMTARQQPLSEVVPKKRTMDPMLIVMLVALAAFPFVAPLLPSPIAQHLDVLFH
jgi:hypothetical protein